MRNRTDSGGFTLIELTIVVMVIGILAAITIPNYVRFARRAKEAVVQENMHTVQLAVESFAVDQVGVYPRPADEPALKALLPQGRYPNNPFTDLESAVLWNVDPANPGEMSISNLPGGGYRLRGRGANALLSDLVAGD